VTKVFGQQLHLSHITVKHLKSLGITTKQEIATFLFPDISRLAEPFRIPEMGRACDFLLRSIRKCQPVFIFADGDTDGITGAAMLVHFFSRIGVEYDIRLNHRLEEYEIEPDFIDRVRALGYGLLVTVDTGTGSHEALRHCEESGFPAIVIDHHLSQRCCKSENVVILNPAVSGSSSGRDEYFTGAGLVFKLIQALRGAMNYFPEEVFSSALELATIGTIGDHGILLGENRTIVKLGLASLQNPVLSGLRRFKEHFYSPIEEDEIGGVLFYLNPKLNTPGRFGRPEISLQLLTVNSEDDCTSILNEIENLERKKQKLLRRAFASCSDSARKMHYAPLVVLGDIPASFSGTIASRLCEDCGRPALALIQRGTIIQGSARSAGMVDLYRFFNRKKELFLSFGGHASAVGIRFERKFLGDVEKYWRTLEYERPKLGTSVIHELPLDALTVDLLREISLLKPFGPGNPEILLKSDAICVKKTRQERGKTVAWVKKNDVLFEAHFPESMRISEGRPISIVFSYRVRKVAEDLFLVVLNIRDSTGLVPSFEHR